jgi:DNA recombination protein RmuC
MTLPIIITALLATALGLLAGFLLSGRTANRLRQEKQEADSRLASEQARWQTELKNLTSRLDEARQQHQQQLASLTADYTARLDSQKAESERTLQAQKEDAERALQAQKADAAQTLAEYKENAERTLQATKDDNTKNLADYKEEVRRRHEQVLDETRQAYQKLIDEQERRHQSDTRALEERFEATVRMVKEQVLNTSDEMLKRRQEEFSSSSSRNIDSIVKPLKETIDKMKEEMAKNSSVQTTMSAEIKTNMEHIIRQSLAAQKSAEELTRAFKHESKTQGDWGEVILSNLLRQQGFTEGKDFEVQAVMRDADGHTIRPDNAESLRPDVLLHLDDRRDVIIDSKVSMTAFINYANADDEITRRQYLREHIRSIKDHVDELSAKNYTQYQLNPHLDFVIMFVPQPPALWAATAEEPSLWQDAMQKKVFIADEQTLYAALRIIRITWTHIDQEENHKKLYALAQEMIDRTGNFLKEYDSVGKNLHDALDAFDSSRKKLLPGGRSIGTTASQILALGIDNVRVSKGRKGNAIIPNDYVDATLNLDLPATETPDSASETPETPLPDESEKD